MDCLLVEGIFQKSSNLDRFSSSFCFCNICVVSFWNCESVGLSGSNWIFSDLIASVFDCKKLVSTYLERLGSSMRQQGRFVPKNLQIRLADWPRMSRKLAPNFILLLRESINKKSDVSMDTFRTPLSPPSPPRSTDALRWVFFFKTPTSDSRQLERKKRVDYHFWETYTF